MRPARLTLTALAAALALVTAACGGDTTGDTASPSVGGSARTVDVEMVDMGFKPAKLTVAKGEEVTFRFTNTGKIAHDAFVGDPDAQADHEEEMGDPHGGHGASEDDALIVEPGGEAELTYTFEEAGRVEVGCHQPGHYKAGMKIDVIVE